MLPGPAESVAGPIVKNGNEMCQFPVIDGGN